MKKLFACLILTAIVLTCSLTPEAQAAKKKSSRKSATSQTQPAYSHNYYKGLTKAQAEQADKTAREIAEYIKSNKEFTSDLQKVRAASRIVAGFCQRCVYGNDPNRYYRTPYGVFVAGVFTCAGATRALGRVLDFMGYKWEHANENKWSHQWCIINMDGQKGFADGQVGLANYGSHPSAR